jgi:hypothetical protein
MGAVASPLRMIAALRGCTDGGGSDVKGKNLAMVPKRQSQSNEIPPAAALAIFLEVKLGI